jgi:PKD repeat protein
LETGHSFTQNGTYTFDYSSANEADLLIYPADGLLPAEVDWIESATGTIELTAEISSANQTVTLNKYFANAFRVDRGDGSAVQNVTAAITHTYTGAGTYTITLTNTAANRQWTFQEQYEPFIPID